MKLLTLKKKLAMFKLLVRYEPIFRIFCTIRYECGCLHRELNVSKLGKEPPRTLAVEVTDVCSANCVFCAYQFTEPKGPMSMGIFKKAIGQYKEMGGKVVNFTPMVGDSLCDPFLFERIKLATSMGLKVNTHTNGILLSGKVDRLLESGINSVGFSAAFDREMFHRVFRPSVKSYGTYIDSILELLEANQRKGYPVKVNIICRIDSLDALPSPDFERIVSLTDENFQEKNIDFEIAVDDWCGQIKDHHLTGDMKFIPKHRLRRIPCGASFNIYVLRDGSVRACGCRFSERGKYDELVLGNLKNNTLRELWYGEKNIEIRRSFVNFNPPDVCKKCTGYSPGVQRRNP